MADAITTVHHDAGGAARGVQRQHRLDGDVHGGDVERLKPGPVGYPTDPSGKKNPQPVAG